MKYNRILLKLSGEALMGDKQFGIDTEKLTTYAEEIKSAVDAGAEVAVVIGGGNIFRGVQVEGEGLDRVQGDYMGMLATIINGMALQSALEKAEVKTRLLTAIKMEQVAEPYIAEKGYATHAKRKSSYFWWRNRKSIFHYRYSCYITSY